MEAQWSPRPGCTPSRAEVASRKAAMGSSVLRWPRFSLQAVADPVCARDGVVVRVRACGVCGSDTHCLETDAGGWMRFSGPTRAECVPGHEYAGEVVEVGPEVRELRVGDLVTGEGMLGCGTCRACRSGQPNQCPALEMVGFSAPGAFATHIAAHPRTLWRLTRLAERWGSADAALEGGALVEPLACGYNGMFVAAGGFAPGAHVAVFGCGPIGLGAVMLARAAGASCVVAFDGVPERRALAQAFGADEVHDPAAVVAHEVLDAATRGEGVDMLVEAAGAAVHTMPHIERAFAPGGRMVYLGRTGERAPVMLDVLVTQAAGIVGARGHAGGACFPNVLRLMESGRIDPRPMIGARYPLSRVLEALERSRARTDGKVMVRMEDDDGA
jgi:threonine dehydrogenase-like Zn-dependent dehydrogenase